MRKIDFGRRVSIVSFDKLSCQNKEMSKFGGTYDYQRGMLHASYTSVRGPEAKFHPGDSLRVVRQDDSKECVSSIADRFRIAF